MEKEFSANIDFVYINCIETAKQLGMNVSTENLTDGIIYFKTKVSLRSFGETVVIKLTEVNGTTTLVDVKSKANAQIIVWGKNTENENYFLGTLTKLLKEMK